MLKKDLIKEIDELIGKIMRLEKERNELICQNHELKEYINRLVKEYGAPSGKKQS